MTDFHRRGALVAILFLSLCWSACAQETTASQTTDPETSAERWSYSIGADLGRRLAQDGIEVDADQLIQGLRDGLAGNELALSDEEMGTAIQELQQSVMATRDAARAEQAETNKAAGAAFLAENAEREGIVTTESGLQYEVIEAGSGDSPSETDQVKVHYRGTLIDGTVFDSSYERGEPVTFPVNRVIPGWTEALQLMKEGAKWKLYIPSELAYGETGPPARGPEPPVIGPNATLIFDVELLEIVDG